MVIEDPLELYLAQDGLRPEVSESIGQIHALLNSTPQEHWKLKPEPLILSSSPLLSSTECPPELDLKPLPKNLKYTFLGPSETLPIILNSNLTFEKEGAILPVLREHKMAIGWTMANIKGVSPSLVQHRIHLEDHVTPTRDAQHRLNPHVKEVVREDVV